MHRGGERGLDTAARRSDWRSRRITSGCSPRPTTCAKERAHFSRSAPRVHGRVTAWMTPVSGETREPAASRCSRLAMRDFRNLARVELDAPGRRAGRRRRERPGQDESARGDLLSADAALVARRARCRTSSRFGAAGFHLGRRRSMATAVHDGRASASSAPASASASRVDGAEPERLSDALGALAGGDLLAARRRARGRRAERATPLSRRRAGAHVAPRISPRCSATAQRSARRNAALRDALRAGRASRRRSAASRCGSRRSPSMARCCSGARASGSQQHGATLRAVCARRSASAARVRMRYASALDGDATTPEQALAARSSRSAALDLRRGITHAGPHRDDLDAHARWARAAHVRLGGPAAHGGDRAAPARGGDAARAHGRASRSVLLDDPFAELDARRASRILELLARADAARRCSPCRARPTSRARSRASSGGGVVGGR